MIKMIQKSVSFWYATEMIPKSRAFWSLEWRIVFWDEDDPDMVSVFSLSNDQESKSK